MLHELIVILFLIIIRRTQEISEFEDRKKELDRNGVNLMDCFYWMHGNLHDQFVSYRSFESWNCLIRSEIHVHWAGSCIAESKRAWTFNSESWKAKPHVIRHQQFSDTEAAHKHMISQSEWIWLLTRGRKTKAKHTIHIKFASIFGKVRQLIQ